MINSQIQKIQKAIEPLRQEIIMHKTYAGIEHINDLKIFMQHHIYAVWDFMSLLKALQNNLTCTTVPWFPVGNAETRFLINEIVVGEEADVDLNGVRKSHFELYLDAMNQCGADTSSIEKFIFTLKQTGNLNQAFEAANTPETARNFVKFTFDVINSGKDYLQAAIFTFGREDLIPGMFMSIVNDINEKFPNNISVFKYYLERHIEVDGDHHSQLALQMTTNLCGPDEKRWEEALTATMQSLKMRAQLWDGVAEELKQSSLRVVG